MTFLITLFGVGAVLWFLNLCGLDSSAGSSSSSWNDSTSDYEHDQDTSSSCSWCGSSMCSGCLDCLNSSNPLSSMHDDNF